MSAAMWAQGAKGVILGVLQGTKASGDGALRDDKRDQQQRCQRDVGCCRGHRKSSKGCRAGAIAGAKEISLDTTEAALADARQRAEGG